MKNLFIIITAFSMTFGATAQSVSIDRSAVASGGESTDASGLYLDYTIGELITETAESGELIITHGMQQPDVIVVKIIENEAWNGWKVFPNPAESRINIRAPQGALKIYSYTLTDRQSKRLLQEFGCMGDQEINLTGLPAGHYILTLLSDSQQGSVSFKVIKTR